MVRRLPRPTHATVIAYVALFVALGGGAYAATSNSSTRIHACYSLSTGTLRLSLSGRCRHRQRAVSWSQEGPTGPAGPQGAQGSQGAQGPQGTQGPTGIVDTSNFYTQKESDARYLAVGGTAANSSELAGQLPGAFAQSSLLGNPSPMSSGASGDPYCILGEIKLTATVGASLPTNWLLAHGQTLSISSNTALFSLLGTTYGGNGITGFALPNLQGAEPRGQGPTGVNYAICVSGIFP